MLSPEYEIKPPSLLKIESIVEGIWEPDYSKWRNGEMLDYLDEFHFYGLPVPVDFYTELHHRGIIIRDPT